jgi:hypothetical protein
MLRRFLARSMAKRAILIIRGPQSDLFAFLLTYTLIYLYHFLDFLAAVFTTLDIFFVLLD